jgi:hypothetical protein
MGRSKAPPLPVAVAATSIAAVQRDGSTAASANAAPMASKSHDPRTPSPTAIPRRRTQRQAVSAALSR